MKKLLAIFSVLAFLGVYAAPALTMPQDVAAKIVAVDKDKKKATAKKADANAEKAASCSESKGTAASCCDKKGAAECKTAASCKEGAAKEKK